MYVMSRLAWDGSVYQWHNGRALHHLDLIEGCDGYSADVENGLYLTVLSCRSRSKLICPVEEETLHHCHSAHPEMGHTTLFVSIFCVAWAWR